MEQTKLKDEKAKLVRLCLTRSGGWFRVVVSAPRARAGPNLLPRYFRRCFCLACFGNAACSLRRVSASPDQPAHTKTVCSPSSDRGGAPSQDEALKQAQAKCAELDARLRASDQERGLITSKVAEGASRCPSTPAARTRPPLVLLLLPRCQKKS